MPFFLAGKVKPYTNNSLFSLFYITFAVQYSYLQEYKKRRVSAWNYLSDSVGVETLGSGRFFHAIFFIPQNNMHKNVKSGKNLPFMYKIRPFVPKVKKIKKTGVFLGENNYETA